MPGSFHLSFLVIFGDEVTKISCHLQAKTVQLIFLFFVICEKWKWDETLISRQKWPKTKNKMGWTKHMSWNFISFLLNNHWRVRLQKNAFLATINNPVNFPRSKTVKDHELGKRPFDIGMLWYFLYLKYYLPTYLHRKKVVHSFIH